MAVDVSRRVDALRAYMDANGLAAFIIVSSDPHSSEYVADKWKTREWISGFDGSAGTAVITKEHALLWTDSRYWLAAEELFAQSQFRLMKDGAAGTPSIAEWLCENLAEGDVVGVDGTVCSLAEVSAWESRLSLCGIRLDVSSDPFDELWRDRPSMPMEPAMVLPLEYAGETASSKLGRLRRELAQQGACGMLVTMLDEVAWLTNIRGNDVQYNPVVVSYLLVTADTATLFVQEQKIPEQVQDYLVGQGYKTAPYSAVWDAIAAYDKENILLQPNRCNAAIVKKLNNNCKPLFSDSPVAAMKAVKNDVEIEGFKKAMLSEGVAMVKLLHWLEKSMPHGGITELDVDKKLTELRSADNEFRGLSFSTIAAYASNAAIVHYEPTEATNTALEQKGMLLLDCGGQYMSATTDVTRTIPLGTLSIEEKEDYTRVLKGHISLAMAKFPKGACGTQIDVLARQWLWQAGENYLHGTGHGVGHFLNVHEGPHQIRMNNVPAPLLPGMTVTNEPGLYKAGRHGIRIENTMLIVADVTTEFGDFCSMIPLTLCPIDKRPIIPELLGTEAKNYLDDYHARVYGLLSPYFEGEQLDFLKKLCAPL